MKLVELITVGVIVAGVAAIGIPVSMGVADAAKDAATKTLLQQVVGAQQQEALGASAQYDETMKSLEPDLAKVDFTVIADRVSGASYTLLKDDSGDLWVGNSQTGDTSKINKQILTALKDAGIDKDQVGGPIGRLLKQLDTGTLNHTQVAAILGK